MTKDTTKTVAIAALLLAVGIMAYGWGRAHDSAEEYRLISEQYARSIQAQEDRYNALQDTVDMLTYRLEQRARDRQQMENDIIKEKEHYSNERKTLDTAGGDYLSRIILWANQQR